VESLYDVFTYLGGATAILVALFAFISKIWLSKIIEKNKNELQIELKILQNELDLTNRKIDAEIQNSIYISQKQLEHEYTIYQEIWTSLIDLKRATMDLRPMMDYVDPNKKKEKILFEKLSFFSKKYNNFVGLIHQHKPFYPQTVFDALDNVCLKCRHESIDTEYIDRKNSEYYKEAELNRKEIISLINDTCTIIRSRLEEVRVK